MIINSILLGVAAAKAGTLTFMVGGPERTFREIQPLLLKMGSKGICQSNRT